MTLGAEFIVLFLGLFVITDPLGNVGIFLSLTEGDDEASRRKQALKGNLYATILLLIFLFGGPRILHYLGISLNAVHLAGGLIVGGIGWGLLMDKGERKQVGSAVHAEAAAKSDLSFCPLALPLIAGPGAIALVITAGRRGMEDGIGTLMGAALAVIVAMVVSTICILQASLVLRLLGSSGTHALTKLMGFLLVCIAAQMVITGAQGAFEKGLLH